MEVSCHAEYDSLTLRNAFLLIGPLAGELDSGLDGFGTRVHRQNHVIAEHGCHLLSILAEDRIVERPRGQRKLLRLFNESRKNSRMTMSLNVETFRRG